MHADRLGRFELVRRLASGGMAQVYLARVSGLAGFERHVVLKVLRVGEADDPSYVSMFLDEARLAATLHHQHVAQVYDVGRADDRTYFLAMEFVHGESVNAVLETAFDRGVRLPLDFALSVTAAAASGLHHAHERRGPDGAPLHIVHRDVTPSNVLVSFDGSVKLIDFGIAKAAVREARTRTGFIKGKVGYMAPEQARGYPVDRRGDVFALGVLAYELTTQERAFQASSQFETTERIVHGEIVPPSRLIPGYPEDLEAVVLTALQIDPDDRFQTADELRLALEQVARRLGIALGGAPVMRCLGELFGPRPEPWMPQPCAPRDRRTTIPVAGSALFERRAHAFARGSGTQDALPRDAPHPHAPDDDDDDVITEPIDADELLATNEVELVEATRGPVAPVVSSVPDAEPPRPRPRAARSTVELRPAITPAPAQAPMAISPRPPATLRPTSYRASPARSRQAAAVIAAGLCVGVVVALLVQGDRAPSTRPRRAPAPPPASVRPVRGPSPTPAARPAPAARSATTVTTIDSPHPAEVTLRVTTVPAGATVVLDGKRLGTTPYTGKVPARDKPGWLKVRMRGHVAVKTRVSLDGDDVTWDVGLRKRTR